MYVQTVLPTMLKPSMFENLQIGVYEVGTLQRDMLGWVLETTLVWLERPRLSDAPEAAARFLRSKRIRAQAEVEPGVWFSRGSTTNYGDGVIGAGAVGRTPDAPRHGPTRRRGLAAAAPPRCRAHRPTHARSPEASGRSCSCSRLARMCGAARAPHRSIHTQTTALTRATDQNTCVYACGQS